MACLYGEKVPTRILKCSQGGGGVEESILLGCDAASLGNRIPTFRGNVLTSSDYIVIQRHIQE